jgi:branched-chain amino acid transport system substrate-binding protein
LRTIARMTAFRPGQSPPPVNTPIRMVKTACFALGPKSFSLPTPTLGEPRARDPTRHVRDYTWMDEEARGVPLQVPDRVALLYDRDCSFCKWCLNWIMRWDRGGRLRPVAIQSAEGEVLLADLAPEARLDSWHLVSPDGKLASGGAAAAPLARMLPGGRPLAFMFETFPGATERAYRWVADHRGTLARLLRLHVLLVAAAVLAGCSSTDGGEAKGPLTVYLSTPLQGEHAAQGRAIANGARLALADAGGMAGAAEVRLRVLDDAQRGGWSPAAVADNARAAAEDTSAIAYIGDLESGATRTSLPITNQAALPQVSAASTALDLTRTSPEGGDDVPEEVQPTGERTFLRVIPDDVAQAEAGAASARELGARRVAVVTDGSEYGDLVAGEFAEEAPAHGLTVVADVTLRPRGQREVAANDADLVYLAGESEELLALPIEGSPILLATDALLGPDDRSVESATLRLTAAAQAPEQLPPEGREFVKAYRVEYGREPDPYAAYGYEAMALVLDAIERAGGRGADRSAVLDELLATTDRDSILGTYSIGSTGDTTLDAIASYRVEDGKPVFDTSLVAP